MDTEETCNPHISERETLSQHGGHYFHDLNHQEQEENPHNHHEQQENPIYGNIITERGGAAESCYEMMTMQRTRECRKALDPDLNYASLDLKVANRRKNRLRHQQGQTQGRNTFQDQLPAHLTPPAHTFFEVDANVDAHLPPRDTSNMVSHSSIYLNSQQIAQEAEEREKSINTERENTGWDDIGRHEDGESKEWKGEKESEERKDGCDENACTQRADIETIQDSADHFTSSLSHDSDQEVCFSEM
ncbi:uncharacterized protein LOC114446761 isoform X2 [Parambassis ranga]|uniref:Uncharacterized protein LOC114446761 isoform X2 n=1 Tax=Parambassis ranga TaxID=210632 RepID=A0A6P7JN57_9TELE|nr:uncharacterized protein LOC114446761 isoform X2 [Parambassis ranga]